MLVTCRKKLAHTQISGRDSKRAVSSREAVMALRSTSTESSLASDGDGMEITKSVEPVQGGRIHIEKFKRVRE
jgi:hypothetical protein